MSEYLDAVWAVLTELAPWLLLGALVAGLLHVALPTGFIKRWLGGRGWRPVLLAAAAGVPMPLCSCAVIPTGLGLKRDGAGNGPALSFLISTPQTGVDSLAVTAAFLGWPFALFKMLAALITGFVGGLLAGRCRELPAAESAGSSSCGATTAGDEAAVPSCCGTAPEPASASSSCCEAEGEAGEVAAAPVPNRCGGGWAADEQGDVAGEPSPRTAPVGDEAATSCCSGTKPPPAASRPSAVIGIWQFAVDDLLRMIWRWLLVGVLVSAALSTWIDTGSWAVAGTGGIILALLGALVISLPLYVCATASVPIAAALVTAGLPTGAALVFLMAGPATNIATIGAVRRALGLPVTIVYLATVILGSLAFALLWDIGFGWQVQVADALGHHQHEEATWWGQACAVVLCLLMIRFLWLDWRQRRSTA